MLLNIKKYWKKCKTESTKYVCDQWITVNNIIQYGKTLHIIT